MTGNSNHFIKNLIIITGISINFVQHFTKISPRTLLQIYAPDKKPKNHKKNAGFPHCSCKSTEKNKKAQQSQYKISSVPTALSECDKKHS